MTGILKWIFLLTVGGIQAQDPRRRSFNPAFSPVERFAACSEPRCFAKRSAAGLDEMGPFWANRGKKNPNYKQESLYAEEPYWVLVRRDVQFHEDPFFISRGKKERRPASFDLRLRDRRPESTSDVDSPFFAEKDRAEAVTN